MTIQSYIVQPGDGWYSIARHLGIDDPDRLAIANGDNLSTMLHPGRILWYDTPETEPPSDFPTAWWSMSSPAAIEAHAAAGFTHNVLWTTNVGVPYLDRLHSNGIKAITFLKPELVDHPAVVAAIVADEPDLIVGGVPKNTPEKVANEASRAHELWPGLPIFSTMGSPCAAGPLSATEAESTDAGYWSLSAGPHASPEGDQRFAEYASVCDVVAPQMYTVAGNPDQPKYRRQNPLSTITAAEAGVRQSDFLPEGMARARRLLPGVGLWALLAPTRFNTFGRKPTAGELVDEARDVIDGGGKGILYFDKGVAPDGSIPTEALISDPDQLSIVTEVITELNNG